MKTESKEHPLKKIVWGIIPVTGYRGVEVWRLIGGYKLMNRTVKTELEVDNLIDEFGGNIRDSIYNQELIG